MGDLDWYDSLKIKSHNIHDRHVFLLHRSSASQLQRGLQFVMAMGSAQPLSRSWSAHSTFLLLVHNWIACFAHDTGDIKWDNIVLRNITINNPAFSPGVCSTPFICLVSSWLIIPIIGHPRKYNQSHDQYHL
jgi:hypothetical protein